MNPLRHPIRWLALRRFFGDFGDRAQAALQAGADEEIYVSRHHRWKLPDCGAEELRTAARWSRRAGGKAARAKRQGGSRDVRARAHERAAELLEGWAELAGDRRVRELRTFRRFRIYREAYDWRRGGLS